MDFLRCDNHLRATRRAALGWGALGAFGVALPDWLALRAQAGVANASPPRANRCVLIWLDGGPSHLDTWDPKPDAPQEVRGPFQTIATRLPGVRLSELFPQLADRLDRAAMIRSLTSPLGEHNFGAHYLLTGYRPTPALEYPAWGAVVSAVQSAARDLPHHIAIPDFRVGGGRFTGNGYLPAEHQPFAVGGDPARPEFEVRDLNLFEGLDARRLNRRRRYLQRLAEWRDEAAEDLPDAWRQAYQLVLSPDARAAFDLQQESPDVRNRYGRRTIGQSCLLARRLLERDVPFLTINYRGWDTHSDAYTRLKEGFTGAQTPVGLAPSLDQALAALLDDLSDRGLLEDTLVVAMGEFGRTPKINTSGGRDHWPRAFSVLLAGAGIPGQVIGASDRTGECPQDRPVTPEDLAATVFTLLGVDPRREFQTADGRPIQVSRDGTPLPELLA